MANIKLAGRNRARTVRDLLERYENEAETIESIRAKCDDDVTVYEVDGQTHMTYCVYASELITVFEARMANIAKELSGYGIDVSAEDPTLVVPSMDTVGERS